MLFSKLTEQMQQNMNIDFLSISLDNDVFFAEKIVEYRDNFPDPGADHVVLLDNSTFISMLAQHRTIPENAIIILDKHVENNICLHEIVDKAQLYCQANMSVAQNIAILTASSFSHVYSRVCDILFHTYQAQSMFLSLSRLITSGKNPTSILSEIGQKSGSFLVVIDMSGKILASSAPFHLNNLLWKESIQQGYCPPDFIKHLLDMRRIYVETNQGLSSHVRLCEDDQIYYLFHRIVVGNMLYGYVFMIQETPDFADEYKELLPKIGHLFAVMGGQETARGLEYGEYSPIVSTLSRPLNPSETLWHKNLLRDLLDGIPKEEAQARLRTSGMQFPDPMCVCVVRSLYYHGNDYLHSILIPKLEKLLDSAYCFSYRKNAIAILKQKPPVEAEKFCTKEGLLLSYSNTFASPENMGKYYTQAFRACVLSRQLSQDKHVIPYSEIAFYDLLDTLAADRDVHLPAYCHPALAALRSYDEKNNAHLYKTLHIYTKSGFNQNLAAKALFLHRNTLTYRIKKIEEITGITLDDPSVRFALCYSFCIDWYTEHNLWRE